ncbi:hypothetical protein J2Z31_002812 [Sinorhizobium kostiense]|uniref:Uncharacterized protein n=1 Tax=Sinorhizobium kostiense TaxID=76747 RepID=A0ABS4R081_9HYPH|nr:MULTISPECIES: hypothetical protein [Sinorhizobium]MBP2236298.1 hypothetical protein [Sinorhizobium kostiense]
MIKVDKDILLNAAPDASPEATALAADWPPCLQNQTRHERQPSRPSTTGVIPNVGSL